MKYFTATCTFLLMISTIAISEYSVKVINSLSSQSLRYSCGGAYSDLASNRSVICAPTIYTSGWAYVYKPNGNLGSYAGDECEEGEFLEVEFTSSTISETCESL